jgi:hypothetical protein
VVPSPVRRKDLSFPERAVVHRGRECCTIAGQPSCPAATRCGPHWPARGCSARWLGPACTWRCSGPCADGIAGSKSILQKLVDSGTLVYAKIDKILGEGNFVLVIGQGSYTGTPYSFYDIFRMANGKITEHWDVLQPLTPPAQAKNFNGQFNFPQNPLPLPTS